MFLEDNWFMGFKPHRLDTLEDFREATGRFIGTFRLKSEEGNSIYIRMSEEQGVFIIDSEKEGG